MARLRLGIAGLPVFVLSGRTTERTERSVVAVALIEVETVQVVGHLTGVEGMGILADWRTVDAVCSVVSVLVGGGVVLLVVAVHYLNSPLFVSFHSGRLTEHRLRGLGFCRGGAYPAVFHIAVARLRDTGTCECAADAEVIDVAAESAEQRVVEAADGMAVAVEGSFETCGLADGGPSGRTAWRTGRTAGLTGGTACRTVVDVGTEEELQVLGSGNAAAQRLVSLEGARLDEPLGVYFRIAEHAQVEQALQQVKTVLAARLVLTIVIDIYLRLALHVGVIHIVVVFLGLHHLLQVVVVSYAHRHVVRVGLA